MPARCRICGGEAKIYLRYANLPVCEEHFFHFFERRVERTLRRYGMVKRGERVAVAVSGGKDSVVLLHVLSSLASRLGFEVIAIHVDLGIGEYSRKALEVSLENCKSLGVECRVVKLEEYGFTIGSLPRLRRSRCSVCGVAKRYLLNRAAKEVGADRLATGHTLDDFVVEVLQAFMRGDVETLARLKPALPAREGLVSRIKPLIETPEDDIVTYAKLRDLRYLSEKCPFSRGAVSLEIKEMVRRLEANHPGTMHQLLRTFLTRVQPRLAEGLKEVELKSCKICGEPTSRDVCQFCRLRAMVCGAQSKG